MPELIHPGPKGISSKTVKATAKSNPVTDKPSAPVVKHAVAYVVRKNFSMHVHGALLSFIGGQIIQDVVLAAELVAANAPVIEVEDADDVIRCPHCYRNFTVEQAVSGEL